MEMATHFNILAWEILGTEEPDGLQFMGSQNSWAQLSNHTTTTIHPPAEAKLHQIGLIS